MLALAIRRRRLLVFRFERRWLARASLAPVRMVQETGIVLWALALHLARIRQVRSAYRAFSFPAGRQDAVSAGRRAVVTLADALGTSEGLDLIYANPAEIFVFRGRYDAPEIYKLDASSADALLLAAAFQLQPRDVVFVSTYNLGRMSRVLTQILPAVQAIWQTWDIVRRR